jgi:acylphosphatase
MKDAAREPEGLRRTVLFSGHVQGVGFRFTAERIAQRFDVRGYVRNLEDGRVELVAEGDRQQVDTFISTVSTELRRHIRDVKVSESPATGEFADFGVRY